MCIGALFDFVHPQEMIEWNLVAVRRTCVQAAFREERREDALTNCIYFNRIKVNIGYVIRQISPFVLVLVVIQIHWSYEPEL